MTNKDFEKRVETALELDPRSIRNQYFDRLESEFWKDIFLALLQKDHMCSMTAVDSIYQSVLREQTEEKICRDMLEEEQAEKTYRNKMEKIRSISQFVDFAEPNLMKETETCIEDDPRKGEMIAIERMIEIESSDDMDLYKGLESDCEREFMVRIYKAKTNGSAFDRHVISRIEFEAVAGVPQDLHVEEYLDDIDLRDELLSRDRELCETILAGVKYDPSQEE